MDHDGFGSASHIGKHEEDLEMGDKRDKLLKPLNRVSRACNACRKQKMRCEGAENPPCKRCRNAGLECMFEKPSREASLTGEAGLERIRSLENSVVDIRQAQMHMQESVNEVLATLRAITPNLPIARVAYPGFHAQQSPVHSSPSMQSQGSAPTPTPGNSHSMHGAPGVPAASPYPQSHDSLASLLSTNHRTSSEGSYRAPTATVPPQGMHQMHLSPPNSGYPQGDAAASGSNNNMLPPISTFPQQQNASGRVRFDEQQQHQQQQQQFAHPHAPGVPSSLKRPGLTLSTSNSADSSEAEEDDNGELTGLGMAAPFQELRHFADVAVKQNKIEKITDSEPPSRARTPTSPHRKPSRPAKRRKIIEAPAFSDVVSKGIVSENEARELFRIFYHGCSTFLPVFDQKYDTFEALHERSPFAVDCICMVASAVRDKGKEPSVVTNKCRDEVYAISQASLFSPVTRLEAVQSMLLVSGWSENGWLAGGHAVRMALELSMHNAWPKLRQRMQQGNAHVYPDDRTLVSACRTWFALYIFEHQISYGTGRPAILRDDESIEHCRELLNHPLAMEDDMRLVSTVELMAVRERVNARLAPLDRPIDENTFRILQDADEQFDSWYRNWDPGFAHRYEDAAFYRQSLCIQYMHAQIFQYANALRNINGPDDLLRMPAEQRQLAHKCISVARRCMEITLKSPAYREGMKYAVHYTHVTATFTASLLLRLSRLFPEECSFDEVRSLVKQLAELMEEIPAVRYSLTLKVMLKRYKQSARRQSSATVRSPQQQQQHTEMRRPIPMQSDSSTSVQSATEMPFSPTYAHYPTQDPAAMMAPGAIAHPHHGAPHQMPAHYAADAANVNFVWAQYEATPTSQQPMWVSDQSLGGNMFTQHGMGAFIVPQTEWGPQQPEIW